MKIFTTMILKFMMKYFNPLNVFESLKSKEITLIEKVKSIIPFLTVLIILILFTQTKLYQIMFYTFINLIIWTILTLVLIRILIGDEFSKKTRVGFLYFYLFLFVSYMGIPNENSSGFGWWDYNWIADLGVRNSFLRVNGGMIATVFVLFFLILGIKNIFQGLSK